MRSFQEGRAYSLFGMKCEAVLPTVNIPRLSVTHEHGSWAVVFIPMIIAAGIVHSFSLEEVLFFVAATCAFLMYVPVQTALRGSLSGHRESEGVRSALVWITVLCIPVVGVGIYLLALGYRLILMFAFSASVFFLGNFFLVRRFRKSVVSDLVAIAGLALGAPAMYYVATGHIDTRAWSLWLLNTLFFGSSVFYVHMKLRASGLKRDDLSVAEKLSIGRLNIFYHLAVLVATLSMTFLRVASQPTIVAFLPMMVHAFYGTLNLTSRVHYRPLGVILLSQSILFCFILIIVEHF